ncbi:MAG: hypothetical protein ACRCWF_05575 [Beijerinckiaceae bacterium]
MTATIHHLNPSRPLIAPLPERIADRLADARHVADHPEYYTTYIHEDAACVLVAWAESEADLARAEKLIAETPYREDLAIHTGKPEPIKRNYARVIEAACIAAIWLSATIIGALILRLVVYMMGVAL